MNDIFNFLNKMSCYVSNSSSHVLFVPCKESDSSGDSMILLETTTAPNSVIFGYALIDGEVRYVGVDPRVYLIDLDVRSMLSCGDIDISIDEISEYSIKLVHANSIILKLQKVG